MILSAPIATYGRSFKLYASRLEKLNIFTLRDLLWHFPFRYENYSNISPIAAIQAGDMITIQGQLVAIKNQYTRSHMTMQKATVTDATGTIDITWFNQPFLTRSMHIGDKLSLSGKIEIFARKLTMQSPDYEVLFPGQEPIHTGRLVPIYPETRGVSSKWLRRQIYRLIQELKTTDEHFFTEFLPESIVAKNSLLSLDNAFTQIHFPSNLISAAKARERLSFDELFLMQTQAMIRKKTWERETHGHAFATQSFDKEYTKFLNSLPFTLTNAQQKALQHIFADISQEKPMNRLLQGDVGSGKTIVATAAMYIAYLNGFQSVLMAPTEILATQHFATISNLLKPFGVQIDLVTGSHKGKASSVKGKAKKKKPLNPSPFPLHTDILVGTHAVLSKNITFNKLGLVVIDEQQRFGVEQRGIIRAKGENPHLLTMTATPIPRTVALTMYGDLDLSYLDEMPKGRKQIKTWLVAPEKREAAYEWLEKEIREHDSQAFIICPFIEESENMTTVKAATVEFERLQRNVFPHLKLGLLHGKQKAKEKDLVLKDFTEKKFHILVATPVVEVGIDIPNATVMLIEASERFGLSQLHQLRGRVGRGDKQSYNLLFTESKNPLTIQRLKAMETSNVGAELAELDLKLRGPGDIYGTAQHGVPKLKVASFSNFPLIEKAKAAATDIFMHIEKYPALQQKLKEISIEKVSPD